MLLGRLGVAVAGRTRHELELELEGPEGPEVAGGRRQAVSGCGSAAWLVTEERGRGATACSICTHRPCRA